MVDPWPWRRGTGAILFIAIPALIEWASARTNVTTLRIDCAPDFYGDPGMLTGWPQGSDAYKCEVRNLGSAGLFDIAIILSVDFQEVLRKENGSVVMLHHSAV